MDVNDIKRVLIVGAGTMGQQICVPCIISGYDVVLYDVNCEQLDDALIKIKEMLQKGIQNNIFTKTNADTALKRIRVSNDLKEASQNIDIVSENVPEDPKLKSDIFAEIDKHCPDHTVFTTNTSSLLPSMFAHTTGRPEKFAALHFHDVQVTTIVDVMPHSGTSEETVGIIKDFAVKIGQTPIVLIKENYGYVFNAMLDYLFRAAQSLASNEIASIEDIDRAWMGVTHMKYGPFGIMDGIGLDTVWKITDYWAEKIDDKQMKKNASFLKKYVDQGKVGQKCGEGFYTYPNPLYEKSKFIHKGIDG